MAKNLILVESPAKAKTINKYLGNNFIVEATIGHIRNLPKTKLGVDIQNGYQPQYVTIRGKGDVIKKIKSLAAKSNNIFIATDPDREGEAIAQDIVDILNGTANHKIRRVLFNEITKTGVKKAMDSPRDIDNHLVTSQRARRVMDRIIGYKISPFLWKAIIEISGSSSLSAGRVQSVALKLICDREEEINKFITTEYWSI
ncbi:MAG: toprim domain-containing protein, partial [Ignavibacteriaceae bacterium]